ncbi:polymorphic toxin-type HINT domain-containing protein, partial [Acetivibrio saccincola]
TTPTHPFWVIGKGWVAAGDIEAGDKVYLYSGEGKEVKEVRLEYLDTPIKVYNFEVEDWHTYFVSEQDVFVHNECSELPKQKVVKEGGVTIEHYYPNDHGNPVHLHVKGGGSNTKIGPQGKSLKGQPELSSKQKKVVEDNISEIKAIIKKIQKWIRKQ